MVLDEISEVLGKRRDELIEILDSKATDLKLEKQHQIYGAINEIDLFMQTLSYYVKHGSKDDIGPIKLVKPPKEQKGLFTKLFEEVKGKIKRN